MADFKIVQEDFPSEVVRPLAQIIMLDANHGDCNFVDFCVKEMKDDEYLQGSYKRYLIDTGPGTVEGLNNLKRVIKTYKQPRMSFPKMAEPHKDDIIIDTIQLTHTDEDHCGLAQKLFRALWATQPPDDETDDDERWVDETWKIDQCLRDKFRDTVISFHKLPSKIPDLTFEIQNAVPGKVSVASKWCEEMRQYGIFSEYKFKVRNQPRKNEGPDYIHLQEKDFTDPQVSKAIVVECSINLSFRKTNTTYFTRSQPFRMRKCHRTVFTKSCEFSLREPKDGLKLVLAPPNENCDPPTPEEPLDTGDRMTADQEFYEIQNRMRELIDQQANQHMLCPDIFIPRPGINNSIVNALRGNPSDYPGASLTIVGPTTLMYNEFMRDSLIVEFDQSLLTTSEISAAAKKLQQWAIRKAGKDRNEILNDSLYFAHAAFIESIDTKETVGGITAEQRSTNIKRAIKKIEICQAALDRRRKVLANSKDSDIHNMASVISLFKREPEPKPTAPTGPDFKMLFTGDAFDRECSIRNTLDGIVSLTPKQIDVLKIPHHGSLRTTSTEFYHRIRARVYLICAKQSTHGAPYLNILEAIVSHTNRVEMTHLFFSNPTSLYNGSPIKPPIPPPPPTNPVAGSSNGTSHNGIGPTPGDSSNLNQLLSGPFGPGKPGPGNTMYNYTCYILKHYDETNTAAGEKNAGIILLGHDKDNKLIVKAPEKYWGIWDQNKVSEVEMAKCRKLPLLTLKPKIANPGAGSGVTPPKQPRLA